MHLYPEKKFSVGKRDSVLLYLTHEELRAYLVLRDYFQVAMDQKS